MSKNAFASGKDKWASTLKQSRQNVDQIGKSSQSEAPSSGMPQRKNHKSMSPLELLNKAFKKCVFKKWYATVIYRYPTTELPHMRFRR